MKLECKTARCASVRSTQLIYEQKSEAIFASNLRTVPDSLINNAKSKKGFVVGTTLLTAVVLFAVVLLIALLIVIASGAYITKAPKNGEATVSLNKDFSRSLLFKEAVFTLNTGEQRKLLVLDAALLKTKNEISQDNFHQALGNLLTQENQCYYFTDQYTSIRNSQMFKNGKVNLITNPRLLAEKSAFIYLEKEDNTKEVFRYYYGFCEGSEFNE